MKPEKGAFRYCNHWKRTGNITKVPLIQSAHLVPVLDNGPILDNILAHCKTCIN